MPGPQDDKTNFGPARSRLPGSGGDTQGRGAGEAPGQTHRCATAAVDLSLRVELPGNAGAVSGRRWWACSCRTGAVAVADDSVVCLTPDVGGEQPDTLPPTR